MTHEEMKQNIARRREALTFELVMTALGRHIALAAALCHAFYVGFDEGFATSGEGFNGEYMTPGAHARRKNPAQEPASCSADWRPGCGRPM